MKHSKILQIALFTSIIIGFTKCSSSEIGNSKDVAQDKIYQSYSINYTEGEKDFTAWAQFRFAGSKGTTLELSDPSYVQFDQQRIKVDSSKYSGAYYEHKQDAGLMLSSHSFVFYDINKKAYENGFFMNEFKLKDVPASAPKDQPLLIQYAFEPALELKGDDYIRLYATDTDSTFSITVNATDSANKIIVPVSELKRQKGKELTLNAKLFRTVPLKQTTPEGGQMEIQYALKPVKIKLK
ncbi:hypothetical protein ACQ33O_00695 [Ferruginibacter sp. SUN002]|uniref:hypothetical protein n=1 Tax=Ferruginibacter sp. SUN002 TaxID=2937789 RepID=UPI003D35D9E5